MQYLKGVPLSPGIAMGPLFYLSVVEECVVQYSITDDELDGEVASFSSAIEQVKSEVKKMHARFQLSQDHAGAAILESYLQILDDPLITHEIIGKIRKQKKNAESLFHQAMADCQKQLINMGNAFFKERVQDLKDIELRILRALRGSKQQPALPPLDNAILFAKELAASNIAEGIDAHVKGFVTQYGGATSHAAIVLQAKGLPLISSIDFNQAEALKASFVIIDGYSGDVFFDPDTATKEKYTRKKRRKSFAKLLSIKDVHLPSETLDGYPICLSANMEMMHDLQAFPNSGASGIGLFRSEYLFLSRKTFPSEDEQFVVYKEIVEKAAGASVVMRTFDFGGDKCLSGQAMSHEHNPFLGCRAIRFLLREKELFRAQLKALVRAAAFGNISILFPMISSLAELQESKVLLKEAQMEIGQLAEIPVGCMIEVPSAAIIADLLAKECHFLSIGTNDLVQYSLAVDRGNSLLGDLYSPSHPSILRLIKFIVTAANQQGIGVSVCGEIAANPSFIPLLLGLGVHELSVALNNISTVKAAIRKCNIQQATKLAEAALLLPCGTAIEELFGVH